MEGLLSTGPTPSSFNVECKVSPISPLVFLKCTHIFSKKKLLVGENYVDLEGYVHVVSII